MFTRSDQQSASCTNNGNRSRDNPSITLSGESGYSMPLKLLKRSSKQYNVVSKSSFVISVELLDNGIMECTLDADSTGTDCLQNISQRLNLQQPEFFGLRYISRGVPPRQRWVELEVPLKKQLDKHAEDSQLSLGVMFYVSDVNLLKDEMTRYHYFLQLKSDVIDGKLNCSIEQAISLAAYSLQGEFGDYDPERHTIPYLRDFAILPKELTAEEKYRDINVIFEAVTRQYGSLIGFPPPLAEIYYIMVAQQLDGYGQEAYPAKDDAGNDILICVSASGLVIRRRDWNKIAVLCWNDIKSLMGHKRILILESAQSQRTMQFHFTDPEVVKYVRKMCLLQTSFHKESVKAEQLAEAQRNNSYSAVSPDQSDGPSQCSSNANMRMTPDLIAASGLAGSQYSLNNNFGCHPSTSNTSSGFSSSSFNFHMLQQSLSSAQHQQLQQQLNSMTHPHPSFHPNVQELSVLQHGRPSTPMGSNLPDLGAGLSMNHHPGMNMNPNGMHEAELQSLLPSYRPAPDYDTAVQIKYGHHISNVPPRSVKGPQQQQHLYYDSRTHQEEDEDEPIYQNDIVSQMNSIEIRDSQSRRTPTPDPVQQQRPQVQPQPVGDPQAYIYKPPPPYPGIKLEQQHQLQPVKLRDSTNSSTGSASGKSRSSFSAHSEVLSQIAAQLQQSSISNGSGGHPSPDPIPAASAVLVVSNTDIHMQSPGHNFIKKPVSSTPSSSSAKSSLDPTSTSSSIIHELNRAMATPPRSAPEDVLQEQPIVHPVARDRIGGGQLYGKNIDPNILIEFHSIQKAKSYPNFATAMKRENSKRNRCPNVLPYEDNMIKLSATRGNPNGYINASYVGAHLSGRDWRYVIGQIPLPGNAPSLWQMIWETDAKIIAVLERDSSAPFYPVESGSNFTFGDFQVVDCKSERSNTASIARELIIIYLPKKKQRRVWILPYEEEWKDDVPIHTEHFLCFLEEVNSIQRRVSDASTPLAVFCGTGAGRSGVFVLSDLLLHAADSGHKLRCDSLLNELRTQRMLLVTSAPQYAFVLHTLAKYLAQSRLI